MNIRRAKFSDINRLLEVYKKAREYMKATGNPHQWKSSYPSKKLVKDDIENKVCYVLGTVLRRTVL